jgi:hypothetical protein
MDELLEQLANEYYNHKDNNETVVIACMDYDNHALCKPRLINKIKFNNKYIYILGCKRGDSIEIYGNFKYKGEAIASKYGPHDIWTLTLF